MQWRPLQISVLFILFQQSVGDVSKIFEIKNKWNTGFQGICNIPIKEDTENGWKLEIKFHEKLASFELWAGKLTMAEQGESGSRYIFVNHPYNKVIERGEIFEAEFTASLVDSSGPRVPPVTIKFQHRVIYSDYYTNAGDLKTPASPTRNYTRRSTTTETVKIVKAPTTRTSTPLNEITLSITEQNIDTNSPNEKNNRTLEPENMPKIAIMKKNITDTSENDLDDEDNGSGVESVTEIPSDLKWKVTKTRYPYATVIHKSLLFYEAQRSGRLPDDNRIKWRGDSAMSDKGERGEDLTGGYYDAGDHVKFTFPMAFSMTTLSWGLIEYWEAYQQAGEIENTLKAIKWGIDFILKSYVGKYELYGQVGEGLVDHDYWGRPEDMKMRRPAFKITAKKPGSDLAAECSAALSAASLAFERSNLEPFSDPAYVTMLRETAESLLEFADSYRGLYHKSITDAVKFYRSYSYIDELLWARVWLYRSTGDNRHLTKAEGFYHNNRLFKLPGSMMFSWDDKTVGSQMLLAQVTGGAKRIQYLEKANSYCQRIRRERRRFTKKGLLYMDDWSPLRYAANIAFICQMVADQGLDWTLNHAFARRQIHYMLGDTGRSYVVGFGRKYPLSPHHRASSCNGQGCNKAALTSKDPNPHVLHGALVGGPNRRDVFLDNREDYRLNEVALDHNSCFQGAVAGLLQRSLIGVSSLRSRSHEPWYEDFVNYTAIARTAKPPQTSSGVQDTPSKLHILALSIATLINICLIYSIK